MILEFTTCEVLDQYCRSAVAYRDVGEGREQEAEASPARIAAGRRSCNKTFCNDWVNFIHNYRIKEFK